jgi:hypothetical protein
LAHGPSKTTQSLQVICLLSIDVPVDRGALGQLE